jgi:hypothetical protein
VDKYFFLKEIATRQNNIDRKGRAGHRETGKQDRARRRVARMVRTETE